jgi:hypothetical protein
MRGLYFYFWKDVRSGADCFCLSYDDQDYCCFGYKNGDYYKLHRVEFRTLSNEEKIKKENIDTYIEKAIEEYFYKDKAIIPAGDLDRLIYKECDYILKSL